MSNWARASPCSARGDSRRSAVAYSPLWAAATASPRWAAYAVPARPRTNMSNARAALIMRVHCDQRASCWSQTTRSRRRTYDSPAASAPVTERKVPSFLSPIRAKRTTQETEANLLRRPQFATVGRMAEWPDWIPTPEIQARLGPYPPRVPGGPANPLGSRALYLYERNKDTLYRIHGTNQPEYIGQAVSSGCISMTH